MDLHSPFISQTLQDGTPQIQINSCIYRLTTNGWADSADPPHLMQELHLGKPSASYNSVYIYIYGQLYMYIQGSPFEIQIPKHRT